MIMAYDGKMSKEIGRKWFKQAVHDLKMAERNLDIEGYDVAAFLAHQSIEKLLKGILVLEGEEAPKTHKLDRLAQLLNISGDIIDKIYDLTEDYALSRYPDVSIDVPYAQYNKEVASKKLDTAKEVFKALKDRYKDLEE